MQSGTHRPQAREKSGRALSIGTNREEKFGLKLFSGRSFRVLIESIIGSSASTVRTSARVKSEPNEERESGKSLIDHFYTSSRFSCWFVRVCVSTCAILVWCSKTFLPVAKKIHQSTTGIYVETRPSHCITLKTRSDLPPPPKYFLYILLPLKKSGFFLRPTFKWKRADSLPQQTRATGAPLGEKKERKQGEKAPRRAGRRLIIGWWYFTVPFSAVAYGGESDLSKNTTTDAWGVVWCSRRRKWISGIDSRDYISSQVLLCAVDSVFLLLPSSLDLTWFFWWRKFACRNLPAHCHDSSWLLAGWPGFSRFIAG